MGKLTVVRKAALYVAFLLALSLLVLDRSAAYIHRPGKTSSSVVIYTAEWCPFCRKLRAYLEENEVTFEEYDVEKSLQGGMGFWALRGRGVPVSVIGPEVVYGFDLARINQSLAQLGYSIKPLPGEQRVPENGYTVSR